MNYRYVISFKMVDHFADDAGYKMPVESTIIEAKSMALAVTAFAELMSGESYEILDVKDAA